MRNCRYDSAGHAAVLLAWLKQQKLHAYTACFGPYCQIAGQESTAPSSCIEQHFIEWAFPVKRCCGTCARAGRSRSPGTSLAVGLIPPHRRNR